MLLASCSGGDSSGGGGGEIVTTAPSAPSSLSLAIPGSSPGSNQLPTIGVNGVVSGDTVRLFSDSACATPEIGSAVSPGTSVNITARSALPLSLYTFYANATNVIGTSPCSTGSVSYDLGASPSAPSGLARLNPSTLNGSDSTPELTISGVVNDNTVNIFTNSNCSSEVGSGVAPGEIVNITTSALPLGSYTFYANSANAYGSSSCSAAIVSYNYEAVPSAPSSLSLFTPGSSPGLDSTPTISVGGVVNGNTVRLFSDSACTTTEIGSAVSSDTSVNITVSSALSVSSHTIYANATNAIGTSPCSSLSASYTLASCPANFIPVPHNSSVLTTKDFCVMKYEAKDNGSGGAVSLAAGNPYVNLTIGASQTKCTDLNASNSVSDKYDLISNPEWMTIARNAEGVGANWEAGTSGSGAMFRGHSDNSPAGALSAAADNDPYNGTGNTNIQAMYSGKEQKRTFTLSNGEVIWDLSGNVFEWVDWSYTTAGPQLGPTTCAAGWKELPNVSCGALSSSQYMPFITNLTSTNAVGVFYGGPGGAALRGGFWASTYDAGAFLLDLYKSTTSPRTDRGFRCVYRP